MTDPKNKSSGRISNVLLLYPDDATTYGEYEPDWDTIFCTIEMRALHLIRDGVLPSDLKVEGILPPGLRAYLRQLQLPSPPRKRGRPKNHQSSKAVTNHKKWVWVAATVDQLESEKGVKPGSRGATQIKEKVARDFGMSLRDVQRAVKAYRHTYHHYI
jgi:hypothetical protein